MWRRSGRVDWLSRSAPVSFMGKMFGHAGANGSNGHAAQAPPPADPAAVTLKHLKSALFHAYHEQVARLASMPSASQFVNEHLKENVLASRLVSTAEQLMAATLKDGAPMQAVYREHDILMVRLDTLPGNSKTAADYFTERYGSYVAFQSSVVESAAFRGDGYKVFVHVIFGEEKRLKDGLFMPWASIGLMPVWEAALTEWVAPRVCCNEKDRALLGF
jgi:hypothetical protein